MTTTPEAVMVELLDGLIDKVQSRPADRAALVQAFTVQLLGLIDGATDQTMACTLRAVSLEH